MNSRGVSTLRVFPGRGPVVWGARTDRRWTVVVAATLALPVIWIAGLATLVGVIPELRRRSRERRAADPEVAAATRSS